MVDRSFSKIGPQDTQRPNAIILTVGLSIDGLRKP